MTGTFDIIVVIVVAMSILLGAWKGLLRQLIGLVGVAAGNVAALHLYAPVSESLLRGFTPLTGHAAAFLGVFIVSIMAASILAWTIGSLLGISGTGLFNKISGGFVGGVKGCFIVAVAAVMVVALLPLNHSLVKNSATLDYLRPITDIASSFAPDEVKIKYDEKTGKTDGAVNKKKGWPALRKDRRISE